MTGSTSSARGALESELESARRRIEVSDDELAEARTRRSVIAAALKAEFGGRSYFNGSVAHGDALTPLSDTDQGVVVPDPDRRYGPGLKGPRELQDRAVEAIRTRLKPIYGDLRIELEGRKRSILVRFREPIRAGLPDFTADVIVAIDNPTGDGLYIPKWNEWDRSHPEKHTSMVRAANQTTEARFARLIRLIKHWSRTHDKPLCSWHIKALALESVFAKSDLVPGLRRWFSEAHRSLSAGDTQDPARVSGAIKLDEKWKRADVLAELSGAIERLENAVIYEEAGFPDLALDQLAKLFKDPVMLPAPDQRKVMEQQAAYLRRETEADTARAGAPALLTGTNPTRERPNVRSWAL